MVGQPGRRERWQGMVRRGPFAMTAFLLCVVASAAQAQPLAYTVGDLYTVSPSNVVSTSWLCTIDLANGDLTPIAQIVDPRNPPFTLSVDALDFDPATGRLYVLADEDFFELDPMTGQFVGSILTLTNSDTGFPLNSAGYGLAFAPSGTLYASAGSSGPFFGPLNKDTGVVTFLTAGGSAPRAEGLAIGPDGATYGSRATSPTTRIELVEIEPTDGSWNSIGLLGEPMSGSIGLDFDASGQLWGIERGGVATGDANSTLFVVDLGTGAHSVVVTPTDPISGLQIRARSLAIAPAVPAVPSMRGSASLLLAIALVALVLSPLRPAARPRSG